MYEWSKSTMTGITLVSLSCCSVTTALTRLIRIILFQVSHIDVQRVGKVVTQCRYTVVRGLEGPLGVLRHILWARKGGQSVDYTDNLRTYVDHIVVKIILSVGVLQVLRPGDRRVLAASAREL